MSREFDEMYLAQELETGETKGHVAMEAVTA